MTLSNLDKAEHDRLILENELGVIETAITGHPTTPLDEADCDIYLERVTIQCDQLSDVYRRILNTKPADTQPYSDTHSALSQRIFKARIFLQKLKKKLAPAAAASTSTQQAASSQPIHSIKLPKLELPKFNGSYEDWQSFQDLFTNTVKKNTTISEAEKLSYLRSCVEGEAAQLIKSFTITDLHFQEAWDLLEKRYDNQKEIVQSLVRRLVNQQCVKTDNAAHLQQLLNTTNECLRSLRVLKRNVDNWDDLVVIIIADKMDSDTRADWAKHHRGTTPPTYKEFESFLNDHIRSLLARGAINGGRQPPQRAATSGQRHVATHVSAQHTQQCIVCQGTHLIFHCDKFKSMSSNDRNTFVRSKALCYNCLKSGHSVRDCKSTHKCRKCNKPHNTLLHRDHLGSQAQQQSSGSSQQSSSSSSSGTTVSSNSAAVAIPPLSSSSSCVSILLKTIKLIVTDSAGIQHVLRGVLDGCSEVSYITELCASILGLKRVGANIVISGIGETFGGKPKHSVNFIPASRLNSEVIPVHAYVLPKITRDVQKLNPSSSHWSHINGLDLADPDYSEPGRIDILLGADIEAYILREGIRLGKQGVSPTAQNTMFGWVLFGNAKTAKLSNTTTVSSNIATCSIDMALRKFWELEEVPKVKHLTPEEAQCEEHFTRTITRSDSGQYICRLPFNSRKESLGESKQQALFRFHQLERRFKRQPEIKAEYVKFMREYLELNHMEAVPESEYDNPATYYLPHHCVLREESTTTKLRVVFDGSAKTTTGLSLNDALLVGPVVQPDLFSILLRFRKGEIAVKADIEKMFRNFSLPKEDRDYLRIVWREDETQPIKIYRLTTVTYGTAAAPYQATGCLQKLAEDYKTEFPLAAEAITENTYVDDALPCANFKDEAMALVTELTNMMKKANMCLRKWATNDKDVLCFIDPALRDKETISFDDSNIIKALGVQWKPATDSFQFRVSSTAPRNVTKRVILSELAKVFDPMGWLSPVTINAKIIFQELWKCHLDWDESPGIQVINLWNAYQESLSCLDQVRIQRCIMAPKAKSIQVHSFSDSSSRAYSGCTYLRVEKKDGTVMVNLVAAKTRVAPIKQQSIPRLELCGAELATELVETIKESMKLNCPIYGWTDSTIVLHWLASYPGRWKTFIANRVSKIQGVIPFENWRHVASEYNPADCASRGIPAEEIIDNNLWWYGPPWLHEPESSFLTYTPPPVTTTTAEIEERKATSLIAKQADEQNSLFHRFSQLNTLLRVTAYMLRWNKKRRSAPLKSAITVSELQVVTCVLVKCVQWQHFSAEINLLEDGLPIKSGRLSQLNPFIDSSGILRVGGRLHHANEKEDMKHPMLLPHNHPLTTLIIRKCHISNMHSSQKLTLSTLQQQYWIIRGRDTVRSFIRKCVVCRKQRAELSQQLMGSLPSPRVNPSKPFSECGLDYAGPFNVRMRGGRGQKSEKVYFCIFVCLATKAIHLECVESLSTEDFLACFKRFCARRGIANKLYSDNGTTFVGADKELKTMLESAQHQNKVERELGSSGTKWIFNPPSAPHQGGLWEAGVKAVKYHLRRVIGPATPTKKEFETLLCMVNSRPLCALSSDPRDVNALTPGHFLIGGPLNAVPEPDLTSVKLNRLSRWQQTQQMFQHFWKRWKGEYLTTLQQRFKWKAKRDNLQINDLVIIKDDNMPPMKWKLGRIIATYPGHEGLVRKVLVKTATNEFERPIHKLCPIITCNDDDN